MPHFAVTVIGRDRPGIVAAVSEALLGLDGNIEDSQMSILGGHFAIMLIVAVPEPTDRQAVERRLEEVRETLGLEAIAVSEVSELPSPAPQASHVLTVYGADHPGIVHAVSSALAERGVNITDLHTHLAGAGDAPIYVMMLEVSLGDADPGEVESALRGVGQEAKVEVSLRELEAEAL